MNKLKDFSTDNDFHENRAVIQNLLTKLGTVETLEEAERDEIKRCSNVAQYIYDLLSNIDPHFVSLTKWNQLESSIADIHTYITQLDTGAVAFDRRAIETKFDHFIDNFLPYLASPSSKIVHELHGNVFELNKKTLDLLKEANAINEKSKLTNKKIDAVAKFILEAESGENSIEAKIRGLAEHLIKEQKLISKYNKELFEGAESQSIKGQIEDALTIVKGNKDYTINLVAEVEDEISDFKNLYSKVLGPVAPGQNNLKGEIDERLAELTQIAEDQKQKYDAKLTELDELEVDQTGILQALKEQIEKLLPGATSAGLATGYRKAKESFTWSIRLNTLIFYLSTSCIAGLAYFLHKDAATAQDLITRLASKLPLFIPLIWLSYFASKRRSESQRLQQEYAHKQSLAESYLGFKQQIEELGEEDQALIKKLLKEAVTAIGFNPSTTLNDKHGDKNPVQECVENAIDKTLNSVQNKKE